MAFLESTKRTKGDGAINDINVTPLVDVMLVLLIIFMVITPMLSKGVSVDLVKARNPIAMDEADQEDAVLVAVTRDGKVFLGTNEMAPDVLADTVADQVADRIDKTVYIKSDARATYEVVVDVVNAIRDAGVDTVGLLTEKEDDGSGGGLG